MRNGVVRMEPLLLRASLRAARSSSLAGAHQFGRETFGTRPVHVAMRLAPSSILALFASAALLTACSSGSTTSSSGTSSTAPTSSNTNAPAPPAATETPAADPAPEEPASDPSSSPLFPLRAGASFTFSVKNVGRGSSCATGTHIAKVSSKGKVRGRDAFDYGSFCSAAGSSTIAAGDGDAVLLDYGGNWLEMVHTPLEEGERWSYFNTSYTWKREASVSVAAGSFDDCWTAVQGVSYTAYQTYCRGVGLVRSYSKDLAGNGWDAELSAFDP